MMPTARPVVLVVDDSEIACESVKHTLEKAAFDVVGLTSPFGFIKAIRESQPVLILVDVGLGILNGGKLVALGRRTAPDGCPILLYSSRDAATLERDVISSGADGYITKSTTGQEFVSAVRKWVGPRPRRSP
jgi:two-component system, NtrC family, C4-dicarboxylate transport response regulator DctD